MTKIHLDTDLGGDIDDLCALAMLLKWPHVELTGITTVCEENGRRAGYVKYILQLAHRRDIPVAAGADVSLGCYCMPLGYLPENEVWPEPISPSPNPLDEALELLKRSVEMKALIVGIGPYTNLFFLEKKYPGILRTANMYLMGGDIFPPRKGYPLSGNYIDYNIQQDIQSASYIIQNCSPILVPINITLETALRRAYLQPLKSAGPVGALVARQAEVWAKIWNNIENFRNCEGLPDDIINFQHDPLTCAVALGWSGVRIDELPLKLEYKDGCLYERIDNSGKPMCVVTAVDGNGFSEFWLKVMTT